MSSTSCIIFHCHFERRDAALHGKSSAMGIDVRPCGDACLYAISSKACHSQLNFSGMRKRLQVSQGLPLGHSFRPENGSRSQTNAAALAFDFVRLWCDHVWFASRQPLQEFPKAAARRPSCSVQTSRQHGIILGAPQIQTIE
jgi:hypothetical protein